jgi:hypothetical protein
MSVNSSILNIVRLYSSALMKLLDMTLQNRSMVMNINAPMIISVKVRILFIYRK